MTDDVSAAEKEPSCFAGLWWINFVIASLHWTRTGNSSSSLEGHRLCLQVEELLTGRWKRLVTPSYHVQMNWIFGRPFWSTVSVMMMAISTCSPHDSELSPLYGLTCHSYRQPWTGFSCSKALMTIMHQLTNLQKWLRCPLYQLAELCPWNEFVQCFREASHRWGLTL